MDSSVRGTVALDPEPERESLLFQYDATSVSVEMAAAMGEIKQLAEKMLYHWRTFPIVLPASITDVPDLSSIDDEQKSKITFRDLFIAPLFDELEEVARDSSGKQRKLTDSQLKSIWEHGEFEVDSIHFPGQHHKWHLTELLQKGSRRSHDTLLEDSALSLRLLIITARNRFISHFFSISDAVRAWGQGFWKILDIFIGMPSNSPGDLTAKVREEHMRYLVAELDFKPNCRREFSNFCEYVKEKCRFLRAEKQKTIDLRPPPIPYSYQTPSGMEVDLRLFNKDLINNCLPILSNILEKESKGWHIQYRENLIMDLRGKSLPNEEISERVSDAIMKEYLHRVFAAIESNLELENLQAGIGPLLISQVQSVIAMQKAIENLQLKMHKHKIELLNDLKKRFPVRSRIKAWINEQLHAFEVEFIIQNSWSAHEEAISICEEGNLTQAIYFLRRDLNFIKERELILKKELSRVKVPDRTFSFATRVWLPQNWLVMKEMRGETEIISTVISKTLPPSPTRYGSKREENYSVDKYYRRKTNTRYPFWRWWNYFHRTWAWIWNAMFFLGVVVPWCSPVSLRALICIEAFTPDLRLSQIDGTLYPRESSLTHTLVSRLCALWNDVRKSRKNFEEAPDSGFLGKSCTRHFNRIWNYLLKGCVGSVALVTVFPVMCVTVSTVSVMVAVLTPLWVPVATLLAQLAFVFFYDMDYPNSSGNRVLILLEALVWQILVRGCLQPVAALMFGSVGCPFASAFIILFGLLRRSCRGLWDAFMFHAVIKSRGRVPASDGFIARRTAGPGLASIYFYQILPEQALAALDAQMELDELDAWRTKVLKVIEQPAEEYRSFIQACFRPFSGTLADEGVYKRLCQETSQYIHDLMTRLEERKRRLSTGIYPDIQRRVKLPERLLKVTIAHAAQMLEEFYPDHVFSRLLMPEEEFWERQMLMTSDWRGLACKKLSELFSKAFLTPLEQTDNYFELKVEHLNLGRYATMLKTAEFRDDLDVTTAIHSPIGEVTVRPPRLDVAYFNPNQKILQNTHLDTPRTRMFPWKLDWAPQVFDKLEIPVPIPHPASIAISIFNREHDQDPINFDDAYCQKIIRATKEVPYVTIGESPSDGFDLELSTPENTTYEGSDVVSHLAQCERSFSSDSMSGLPSASAEAPISHERAQLPHERTRMLLRAENEKYPQGEEGKIVYMENERDNRCVVNLEEEDV